MQLTSTVFVLGAGTSAEFKLPVGTGLANSIAPSLRFHFEHGAQMRSGDPNVYRQLKHHLGDGNRVFIAGNKISRGLPYSKSIDEFLYNHGEDTDAVLVGKVGIANAILQAERNSSLYGMSTYQPRDTDDILLNNRKSWLFELLTFLQTDVRKSDVMDIFNGIKFVNFNYDRCVEQFLYYALQRAYSLDAIEAGEIMGTLEMDRPYGRLGSLPWETKGDGPVEYGSDPEAEDLVRMASGISTLTECDFDSENVARVRQTVASARRVVFMGFAFHKQNMALLKVAPEGRKVPVYGTTLGTSESDRVVFKDLISESIHGGAHVDCHLVNESGYDFMRDYGRHLAHERLPERSFYENV